MRVFFLMEAFNYTAAFEYTAGLKIYDGPLNMPLVFEYAPGLDEFACGDNGLGDFAHFFVFFL